MSSCEGLCEIKRRDGGARSGIYTIKTKDGEQILRFPAAYEMREIIPNLKDCTYVNMPPLLDEEEVSLILKEYEIFQLEPIHPIHPHMSEDACAVITSGDIVMAAGWHVLINRAKELVRITSSFKQILPPDIAWYLPAAATPRNLASLVHAGFDLFDYTAVDLLSAKGIFCLSDGEYPREVMTNETGLCSCVGCMQHDLKVHNRLMLDQESARIRYHITAQRFREYLEAQCRHAPNLVSLMRVLDNDEYREHITQISRQAPLFATSTDSLIRPEIKRFMNRVLTRYIPPLAKVAVLLPCSARKPYSQSKSHMQFQRAIDGRAHELIITSPLGVVPRELELVYPAAHYDVPVTGYWDHEERYIIGKMVEAYFSKHHYERVIAHLDGDAYEIVRDACERCGIVLEWSCDGSSPLSHDSLSRLKSTLFGSAKVKRRHAHGMFSYQFGQELLEQGIEVKGRYPEQIVVKNRRQLFSIDPSGMLRPTFDGWQLIETGYRVYIDDFVPQGDILAPGVVDADPNIREGDEVLVVGKRAWATGKAAMSADEMKRSKRGIAVRVRKVRKREEKRSG
ncbi:MAG: DUF5591 domain-containing protein [Methanomicrobiales archaeon]|jgi:archaeosine synthase|nr:DUF5591 domain-containing protein [Methanomicrobiales archaeon]